MATRARVFRSVFVGRIVAAERFAAFLACPQVNPGCADLYALFAFSALWQLDGFDRSDVSARGVSRHGQSRLA